MSKLASTVAVRLDYRWLYPLAIAGFAGYLLSMFHFQSIHYLLFLSILIVSSVFAGKSIRNLGLKTVLRRSLFFVACLLLISLAVVPTRAAVISEYSMFADPRPRGITVDPGGTPWFTEQLRNRIGYLSGTQVVEFRLPSDGAEPWDIVYLPQVSSGTTDPNADSIWFTESAKGRIGRYKGGVFVEFDLTGFGLAPGYTSEYPTGISFDYNASSGVPYRNVWFVETGGNALGKIYYNASGTLKNRWVMSEYRVPERLEMPVDLARNPVNGFMFMCSLKHNTIGSFNPWTRDFRVYDFSQQLQPAVQDGLDTISAIAIGSDGIIWATLDYAEASQYDKIIRLDPVTGEVVTYEIPTQGSGPRGITVDSDKNIWFTEYDKDKIGRLNPVTGYITEFLLPKSGSRPLDISTKSGIVWFTEWANNKIGRLDPSQAQLISTVNTITSATSTSTTPGTVTVTHANTVTGSVIYSTYTTQPSTTATFYTTGKTYGATTMTVENRFATSSVSTNTETVFVLPTSTTASTTSVFTSTFWETTTVSPTLTSAVSTYITSTTTTASETFSSAVATETSYTTREVVHTEYAGTTTQTNFAATSYRFTTVTLPTFTQYATSTIRQTTTETVSTVTTTVAVTTTSTVFTTVTAGMMVPAALMFVSFAVVSLLRRRGTTTAPKGDSR